ncbi:hypothetical protein [Streptomyces sp. NPDC002845]
MDYILDVETTDANSLISAIKDDVSATNSDEIPISDNGVGLGGPTAPRGSIDGVQLVQLLLTIPVGVTVEVAADQIMNYFRRRKYRDHDVRVITIIWTEETLDPDGNVQTNLKRHQVDLGGSP